MPSDLFVNLLEQHEQQSLPLRTCYQRNGRMARIFGLGFTISDPRQCKGFSFVSSFRRPAKTFLKFLVNANDLAARGVLPPKAGATGVSLRGRPALHHGGMGERLMGESRTPTA